MLAVSIGNFRRLERFAIFLVFGSLLLVPIVLLVHPPAEQIAIDFLVPKLPKDSNPSEVMLLIIAIPRSIPGFAPCSLRFTEPKTMLAASCNLRTEFSTRIYRNKP